MQRKIIGNWFAKNFPIECEDGNGIVGTDRSGLQDALNAIIPNLTYPLASKADSKLPELVDHAEIADADAAKTPEGRPLKLAGRLSSIRVRRTGLSRLSSPTVPSSTCWNTAPEESHCPANAGFTSSLATTNSSFMAIVEKKPKRPLRKKSTSCFVGAVSSMNVSVSMTPYRSNVWAPQRFDG